MNLNSSYFEMMLFITPLQTGSALALINVTARTLRSRRQLENGVILYGN